MKQKPRARPSGDRYGWIITGWREDEVFAFGWGLTVEAAYADWLAFDENEIPF